MNIIVMFQKYYFDARNNYVYFIESIGQDRISPNIGSHYYEYY